MIGGSVVVSPDSPPAFGNLLLYRDEIVPWLRRLVDDVHEAGAAVMCQVTHLGRRTSSGHRRLAAAGVPVPAARGPPQWSEGGRGVGPGRVLADYGGGRAVRPASTASRCSRSAILHGFISPATNRRDDASAGALRRVSPSAAGAPRDPRLSGRISWSDPECHGRTRPRGAHPRGRPRGDAAVHRRRHRLPQRHPGHDRERRPPGGGDPVDGDRCRRRLAFAGEIRRALLIPVMHASRDLRRRPPRGTGGPGGPGRRLAPRSPTRTWWPRFASGDEDRIRPCVGRQLLPRRDLPVGRRQVHPQPRDGAVADARPRHGAGRRSSSGPVRPGWGRRRAVLGERGATWSWSRPRTSRRPGSAGGRGGPPALT